MNPFYEVPHLASPARRKELANKGLRGPFWDKPEKGVAPPLWPEMPDPTPTDRLRVVEGVQAVNQRNNPHLLPHQLQGSPGPDERHREISRAKAAVYRAELALHKLRLAHHLATLNEG